VESGVQVGEIIVSYRSPVKEVTKNISTKKPTSVPSKRWFKMVEDDEMAGEMSAPTTRSQQDAGRGGSRI
jgi:hypothetical protein